MQMKIGIIYLIVINLVTVIAYGVDKKRARKNQWRISERTLFFLALVGGSPAALLGMYGFRHKTKHLKFVVGIPVILAVQLGILFFVFV